MKEILNRRQTMRKDNEATLFFTTILAADSQEMELSQRPKQPMRQTQQHYTYLMYRDYAPDHERGDREGIVAARRPLPRQERGASNH